jgi:hypothetical protein
MKFTIMIGYNLPFGIPGLVVSENFIKIKLKDNN